MTKKILLSVFILMGLLSFSASGASMPTDSICQFSSIVLTDTFGTGAWTAAAANPDTAVIDSPSAHTTVITRFNVVGTYKFAYTAAGVNDTFTIVVTAKPNAGPDQTTSCFQTGTVTMAAVGSGTWSAMPGNPGTSVITQPDSPSTVIAFFSYPGIYSYLWTSHGCSDTARVIANSVGNDNCAGAISMGTLPAPAGCGTSTTATKKGTPDTLANQSNACASGELPYPYQVACPVNLSPSPKDVWYSFVASSTEATIKVAGATFTNPVINVWSGNCGSLAGLGCVTGAAGAASVTVYQLTVGTRYYIQVSGSDSTQSGTFTLIAQAITDCSGCLITSSVTATPAPVNGTYQAGQTVTFCYTITGWSQTSSNWLHGVRPTFGAGWNLATMVPGAGPAPCTLGGTWSYYPHGDTSSANGTIWGPGFYYETASGNNNNIIDHSPGDNFGDDDGSNTCTWTFCVTITADTNTTATCSFAGSNLSVDFAVTGDGQSGSWTSTACGNDPVVVQSAYGSCCPPTMSSTSSTCSNPTGGTATATAIGTNGPWTYKWSTGVTVPNSTSSSTITGLSAGQVITVTVIDHVDCSATKTVTIGGIPNTNAGPDQTVTCYPINDTARMAAVNTGTGTWTAAAGNPGTATIVSPTSITTVITNFSTIGTYYFIWTSNGCPDTAEVVVSSKPNAGPDKVVTCAILPGGSATMAAVGTGTWSAQTGNPGTAIITSPTGPTTTITTYSDTGTYYFIWTSGVCTDTAAVVVTAKPNAGPDQIVTCATLPGGSATMGGTGAGTWTAQSGNPGTATITTPTSSTTTITGFTAAGIYYYIWANGEGCTDTATITVTAKPNAGPDQTISCVILPGGSVTMAATGTGTWTAQTGNPGSATITTPASATTTITTFSAIGTYYYIWSNGSCTDTAAVMVLDKPNAGPDQTVTCAILPGGSATMAASGTGTWSAMTGNPGTATITSATTPGTTITGFTAAGVYSFIWTVGTCTDTANVTVTAKPNAGPDQTVNCALLPGGSATMAGTGLGTWSAQTGNPGSATITNPTDSITTITGYTVAGTYYFIWTNASGCTDTAAVVVTAEPNAGADQSVLCAILPGGTAIMAGSGPGTWTAAATGNPGTATIASPTSPTTSITNFSAAGTYAFIYTNGTCADTANVTVTAKPYAGADQTVSCAILPGGSAIMSAIDTGTWTAATGNPGSATITTPTLSNTTITDFSAAGVYYFVWTSGACTDTATVTVTAKPDAGPDQTITCVFLPGGSATMAASPATGTWTAVATGNAGTATITNPSSSTTTITNFSAAGVYSFIWTSGGCPDTMTITVSSQPTISLADTAICLGNTTVLVPIASPAGGTYLWSNNQTTATITVTPSATTGYTVTYTTGACAATASDTVTINPLPVATVTTIASVCTANDGIAIANPSGGTPGYTYSWGAPGGTHDSLTGLTPGSYVQVQVTDINHCTVLASGTVGHLTPAIIVTETGQHNLNCNNDGTGDIYIANTDTSGYGATHTYTYQWSNSTSNQNLTGVQAGTYSVVVTDQFGCTGTASYTITQPPALTGTTTEVNPMCHGYANGSATAIPAGGSGNYYYTWSTTPAQTTAQATGLTAGSYTVIVKDDSLCTTTLSVTLTDPLAIAFSDSVVTEPSCYGGTNGSAKVNPINGIGIYAYLWSDPNHQTSDSATGLAAGTYTVTATDANGCTGTTTVVIGQPAQATVSVTPTNVTCFGYDNGSVTATPAGGTAPYSYSWNNSDSTATITGLGIGPYSVTVTDHNGCTASAATTLTQPTALNQVLSPVRTNCSNSSDGSIIDTASGGTGAFTYTLKDPSGNTLQSGNTSGTFTGLAYGPYIVVAQDQNGCTVSGTIAVPQAPYNVYTYTADSTSCYGSQYHDGIVHLQGYTIPNGPFQYSIDGGPLQITPDFFDLTAGPHQVTAQDNYNCDTTFTVVVPEPLPATVQILPGDSTIEPGESLQLSNVFGPYSISSITNYTWAPGTGLSCIDCPSPVASPYSNITTYTLIVTYNKGCTTSASVTISTNGKPPVYIPNAFTPNGDGVNDVWVAYGTGIKDIKATVFNRWGEKVFESDNQSDGWDGTYKGQAQPTGVYVYYVDVLYLNGEKTTKQGSISLIR